MGNFWLVLACTVVAGGCGAGEARVDPSDLELRDLLGVAPEVAVRWDAAQRASARRVLADGFRAPGEPAMIAIVDGETLDDRVTRTLAALDAARDADGDGALGLVRISLAARALTTTARDAATAATAARDPNTNVGPPRDDEHGLAPATELWLDDAWRAHAWGDLPGRGRAMLAAIAVDAGHTAGPLIIAPASRLSVIAGYLVSDDAAAPRLVINPIVLAAIEPEIDEAATAAAMAPPPLAAPPKLAPVAAPADRATPPHPPATSAAATTAAATAAAGNPYSFYGSAAECAFAQRTRCEVCVAAGDCTPVTDTSDGDAECAQLGEGDGRGYFLLCINLALAIRAVDDCAADVAPACPRSTSASRSLATLEANADFLDDPACGAPLDACLAKIYGGSPGEFPGVDGGTTAPVQPRETTIDCQDSCSNNNSNNTCSGPSADCSGPSCNNSLSCDSACLSSNDQSSCDSCDSDTGGDNSGCGSSSDSSSSGCGDGCGSGSGDSSGCGGDGCGGGGSSDSGCGSCSSSGGGGSKGCSVAGRDASPRAALAISLLWAFLPVPAATIVRRRSRKRRRPPSDLAHDARQGPR